MENGAINVVVGGEAGQGLVTVGQLLAKSLVRSGYSIVVTQTYESRIRGGHNSFAVRVAPGELGAPQEPIDLVVALNLEAVRIHRENLAPEGRILVDEKLGLADESCIQVPFAELTESRFWNTAALGVVGSLLGLDRDMLRDTVEHFFGKKDPAIAEKNRKTLEAALEWTGGQSLARPKLPPPHRTSRRLMLNGNEAIALGAMSAGLKFYAFYPMTPSTSVGLTLIKHAGALGIVVEQAEDEIAAINMALGASFAGAPSMVGTSGGGFALMVEGVSLAGMTETPIVIVVAQRPGPATGLPTRTEQADLEFVLHAGHGEFPRAVFSPGTVEECFHLTRKAMDLAQRFQTPAFVLTDQFLADSYRAVEPFDVENLAPVEPAPESISGGSYSRHAFTESGVSPRLVPGATAHLVVTDSDEHTEDGHITEDLGVRKRMVEKRLRKGDGMVRETVPPERTGDQKPDLLLVTWGSTGGSVLEAAQRLRSGGKRVGVLRFSQVWPLVPDHFLADLGGAGEVVSVEGNAVGQLARLVRRETGFHIERRVPRYDGLPHTPESVLRGLEAGGLI